MHQTIVVTCTCPGFGKADVHLFSVEGEERISQLFSLRLGLTSSEDLDHNAILESAMTLRFTVGGKVVRVIHGMAASIREMVTGDTAHRTYRIDMVPRLWKATLNERHDIYMDLSVPEIVQKKLEELGLAVGDDFTFRLRGQYGKREFVVQYRESDLAFISRLTEQLGISFFFEHEHGRDVLVFSDTNEGFHPLAADPNVDFVVVGGEVGVQTLESRTAHTPGRYIVRDYNYRTPSVDLTAEKDVKEGSGGVIVEYGAHFKTPDEGKWLAAVRAQEVETGRHTHDGTGNDVRFRAGLTFKLEGHPRGDLELVITEVTHRLKQGAMAGARDEKLIYEMTFAALAKITSYRPPRRTPKPKVHGVLTGMIDTASKGQYAEIDAEGRYKVKFLYDTADTPDALASRPVRMAQPHSGAGYGMHFPLRQGVEVALTCVDGDPDRPIIASTVPNPSTPSPVSGGNNARNIIRTGGGNEINIDDTAGEHRIKLSSPHHGSIFQIGSPNYNEDGAALATEGAYTSSAKDITSVLSGTSAVIDQLTTNFSGDIISSASVLSRSPEWWAKTVESIFGLAKSTVAAANNSRKIKTTKLANAADKADADAAIAQNNLVRAKQGLPSSADKAKPGGPPPADELAELQEKLEKAETDRIAAQKTSDTAVNEKARLERELETLKARRANAVAANDASAVKSVDAEIEQKKKAIAVAGGAVEGAAADLKTKETGQASATKARNDAIDAAVKAKTITKAKADDLKASHEHALANKQAQATAAKAKADFAEEIVSDALTSAAAHLDAADAAIQAGKAVVKLVSQVVKIMQVAQKATEISLTEGLYTRNLMSTRRSIYATFTPGLPVTPFNIQAADMTSAVISKACTLIGSVRATTITAPKVGVGAGVVLVMSSKKDAELHATKHASVTSSTLVDIYSKERARVIAHSAKDLAPTGKPNLFLAAKNELEIASTDNSIHCYAKKAYEVQTKTEGIKFEALEGIYELKTKKQISFTVSDEDLKATAEKGGVYLLGKKELKLAGADAWGAVFDSKGASVGSVSAGKDPNETTAKDDVGVRMNKEFLSAKCGETTVMLEKSGTLLFKGKQAYEVKVGGNELKVSTSKILLG